MDRAYNSFTITSDRFFLCRASMFLTGSFLHQGMSTSRQRAKGFTILEAAFASAIATVVLTGLFVLQSNMMRMLNATTETANASMHLQTRVEQVRLANWPQLCDPNWVQTNLLGSPTDADVNLPRLTETYTVTPYQSPSSRAPAVPPPGPFTVTRAANGTLSVSPAGYSSTLLLTNQEMLQVDLSISFPSLGRTRTRAQCLLISPWGISK